MILDGSLHGEEQRLLHLYLDNDVLKISKSSLILVITDVHFSNFDYSKLAEDINELLSYSEKMVF